MLLQYVYMTLVGARSVSDILESYITGETSGNNHFKDVGFSGYRPHLDEELQRRWGIFPIIKWDAPTAHTPYGWYVPSTETGLPKGDRSLTVSVAPLLPLNTPTAYLHVGLERLSISWPGEWLVMDGERLMLGHLFSQVMVFSTVDVLARRDDYAFGVGKRIMLPVPKLNAQVGLSAGLRLHTGARNKIPVALYSSLRAEMGMGLIFTGFDVGLHSFVNEENWLERGQWAVSPSVSVTVPIRRRGHEP